MSNNRWIVLLAVVMSLLNSVAHYLAGNIFGTLWCLGLAIILTWVTRFAVQRDII
jgi:amino acid permease